MVFPAISFPSIPFPPVGGTGGVGPFLLADHAIVIPYHDGRSTTTDGSPGVVIGINNTDSPPKSIRHGAVITEGSTKTIHLEDDSTAYQNTSGFTATAGIVLKAASSGTEERHVRIRASNTVDTADGTILFEIGSTAGTGMLDANNKSLSIGPLFIPTGKYLTIENVDDSRAGANDVNVNDFSLVVEPTV